jgi:copper chaperone
LTRVYPLPVYFIPSPGIDERNDMPLSSTHDVHEYHVDGMTCEHCKLSVTEEVSEVAGVERVAVDLPTGRLTVVGDVDDASIAAAVSDAGYRLVA